MHVGAYKIVFLYMTFGPPPPKHPSFCLQAMNKCLHNGTSGRTTLDFIDCAEAKGYIEMRWI